MLLQIKQKILENLEEIDAYFFFYFDNNKNYLLVFKLTTMYISAVFITVKIQ